MPIDGSHLVKRLLVWVPENPPPGVTRKWWVLLTASAYRVGAEVVSHVDTYVRCF